MDKYSPSKITYCTIDGVIHAYEYVKMKKMENIHLFNFREDRKIFYYRKIRKHGKIVTLKYSVLIKFR
jgi:hypothetical protein